ncbi:hypothetical protein [Azohydromonas lata]|uniref:MFS transporter n=1 Tax=Azohydromonas lata TaxID=45677 RepID=A0ABU5IE91_9BURK|nr:hypothetical protein [Azohydromonas lata]MDZ5457438.1 hypothetical protein [Azohydromonas lata]
MSRNLWALVALQGLFLTNNVTFIAINGLAGLSMAPHAWMATLPVMAYVVGGALCTGPVAWTQARFGRKASFQFGLLVALGSTLLCAWAASTRNFWLMCFATLVAGYHSANGQLYRFTAAEFAAPAAREKAVSLVMAGGLLGAVVGPNLASRTRDLAALPFVGAYLALAAVARLALVLLAFLFTGATTLSLSAYTAVEKDRAQGAINFIMFAVMAVTAFSSGALVSAAQGWSWLNLGSVPAVLAMGAGLAWLALRRRDQPAAA